MTDGDPLPAAPPVPPLRDGAPPLALLIDYDGTIAQTDVSDTVMAEFVHGRVGGRGRRLRRRAGWARARSWSSRWRWSTPILPPCSRRLPPSRTIPASSRSCVVPRRPACPIEIVSDGFGFFIEPAMAMLGVPELPVVTATTTFSGRRASIAFPNGHPTCFVCGTCKRMRVLAHRAAGRQVAFIGDGESDRYAAGYSDIVFAKRSLVRICVEAGWPFQRWTEFSEIESWLAATLDAWRADPSTLPAVPAGAPPPRGYFCGPEIWGDGRIDPPPGMWPPSAR